MWPIPFISSALYLVGGQWLKLARWLIGLPIFVMALICGYPWYSIFAVLTYFLATNIFSYGDKMWTSKLFGRWISMGLSGLTFGLASIPVVGIERGIIQGIIGMIGFLVLKWLDDTDRLKNPWQELGRGFIGTVIYFIA